MVIKEYSLSELAQLAHSGDFWHGEVIPITRHRALAQIRNSRARPEDVVLIVAYDGDRVCGYIGLLPDLVFLDGSGHRLGWITTWWRKPGPKYAGIGATLMTRASELYGGAIGGAAPSAAATKVLEASKQFVTVSESVELRAFIRANTREMLPRKFPTLNKFKLLLGAFDRFIKYSLRNEIAPLEVAP